MLAVGLQLSAVYRGDLESSLIRIASRVLKRYTDKVAPADLPVHGINRLARLAQSAGAIGAVVSLGLAPKLNGSFLQYGFEGRGSAARGA
jgi:hypothetical protein